MWLPTEPGFSFHRELALGLNMQTTPQPSYGDESNAELARRWSHQGRMKPARRPAYGFSIFSIMLSGLLATNTVADSFDGASKTIVPTNSIFTGTNAASR